MKTIVTYRGGPFDGQIEEIELPNDILPNRVLQIPILDRPEIFDRKVTAPVMPKKSRKHLYKEKITGSGIFIYEGITS